MLLGRMIIAMLVAVSGTNIALARIVNYTPPKALESIQTIQHPYSVRIYPNQRASRSQVRKPMTGLKIIPSKKCWDGSVGTVYDVCPNKSLPRPRVTHHSFAVATGVFAWAHSYRAVQIANCESGGSAGAVRYDGNPHLRGFYSGKWQMDQSFWETYGGLSYARNAADASEASQDAVAYRGYLSRGWQPWACSHMV